MSISISDVINGLAEQQVNGLILVLEKAKEYATESGTNYASLMAARLHSDMHPLSWQVNSTLEILLRGAARLTEAEVVGLNLEENNFGGLIKKVEGIQQELQAFDNALLDQSEGKTFDVPIGPDATMSMTGKAYLLKFVLPNFYFHLTTSYDLLRMSGVPIGKRDYMGVS